MKFPVTLTVVGMKFSKGQLDNGQAYDSTKVFALIDLDDSKGNAKGQAVAEYNYGDSTNFDAFRNQQFPFHAAGEIEMTTNGRTQKAVLVSLKPVSPAKPAQA